MGMGMGVGMDVGMVNSRASKSSFIRVRLPLPYLTFQEDGVALG